MPEAHKYTNQESSMEPNASSKEQDISKPTDGSIPTSDNHEGGDNSSVSEAEETESDSGSEASGDFDDGNRCDSDFMFEDANLDLKTEELHFWIHTFILQDFQGLEAKIDGARRDTREQWRLLALKDSAEDVRNTLTVLYTKPYEPHDFDTETLESALKLATKYDNPGLRDYAIQQIDQLSLRPIEQFRMSRDYDIPEWESKAVDTLCMRDDPITAEEASILGSVAFAKIAAEREKNKHERGRRLGIEQTQAPRG